MLLRHFGGYCITKQGDREEVTTCEDCKHVEHPIDKCTDLLLTQKINENVKRINAIFNFKKNHHE